MATMELTENDTIKLTQKLIESKAFSQADLARATSMSEGTISQWIKGKYPGDSATVTDKVKKFLDFREQKSNEIFVKDEIPFVKTSVAKQIHTYAKLCQMDCEISIIHGASGLGKTTAVEEYGKENHGVIILEPDEDCGAKNLLTELYEKLGFTGQVKLAQMKKEILSKLKDSNMLIIIDEGENLRTPCFKALRKLHDKSRCTFGLLFVGTHRLYYNLLRMKGDFEYLTNRIGYNFELQKLTQDDVKALVNTLIKDDDLVAKYWNHCNGNARILSKLIKRSLKLAKMNNTEINPAIIEKCRKMLIA